MTPLIQEDDTGCTWRCRGSKDCAACDGTGSRRYLLWGWDVCGCLNGVKPCAYRVHCPECWQGCDELIDGMCAMCHKEST